jgi:hypothetical protein
MSHLTEVLMFLPDTEEPDGYQPVLVLEQGRSSYAARVGAVYISHFEILRWRFANSG